MDPFFVARARRQRLERIHAARQARETFGWENALQSEPMQTIRRQFGNYLEVEANGRPFIIDLRDTVVGQGILYNGMWEPEKSALFARLLRPGDRVVDVGANIGYYTVLFGAAVGRSGSVLAIEPDADNVKLLKENVKLNRLGATVRVVHGGAGARKGELVLFAREGIANRGDHRTWDDGVTKGRRVRVRMVSVDDCVRSWPSVETIKMDIQGFEYFAFAGMRATLERNPAIALVSEFWPTSMRRAGSDPHAFLAALRSLGFAAWRIRDEGGLAAVDSETLVDELEPDEAWADLVFVRHAHAHERLGELLH